MKYFKPTDVISPKDAVEDVKPIYYVDEESGGDSTVSIAKIKWKGKWEIGIRWNVGMREWNDPNKNGKIRSKICTGVPSSRGYPTWFILPKELLDKNSEMWKALKKK